MNLKNNQLYQFGPYILDPGKRLLKRLGELVPLTPKSFDMLLVLVENSGNVVEKDALMNRLWPDTFVEESNLAFQVSKLRKALGERPKDHRYIVTIPGRGYRFSGQVTQIQSEGDPQEADSPFRSPKEHEGAASGPFNGFAGAADQRHSLDKLEEPGDSIAPVSCNQGELDADGSGVKLILSGGTSAMRPASGVYSSSSQIRSRLRVEYYALAALILVTVGHFLLNSMATAFPRVLNYTQITHDGLQKAGFVTDGSRLYISELAYGKSTLVQVSVAGGDTVPLAVPFANPGLDDISPNGSELIVANNDAPYPFPYWIVPMPGGSPRRLGEIRAHDVHPSPGGQQIAYFVNSNLYLAQADGTNPRKLLTVPGKSPGCASWAPDGSKLRFDMDDDPITGGHSIWEVKTDGGNLHSLLPGWRNPANECCGHWAPNGKYYVFQSTHNSVTHLWAIQEKGSLLGKARYTPVQLTSGPTPYSMPVPSKDGRRIFAIGGQVRGEVMRYVKQAKEWVPYHSEKSMVDLNFSRDGAWVTHVAYPESTLWCSKTDFSESQQLTFPPMAVTGPRWSPDGKQIAFQGRMPGKPWKVYTISSSGGNPQQLIPGDRGEAWPDWSADGSRLAFGGWPFSDPENKWVTAIHLLDLRTNQVLVLPGSEGLFGPRWSAGGRYLLAHRFDTQLMLFDFATSKWQELAKGDCRFGNWSRDGQYVYFERWEKGDIYAVRIRISDRKQERIGSLKPLRLTIGHVRCWSGLAPDDSLLALRDVGSQEIYALDWEAP